MEADSPERAARRNKKKHARSSQVEPAYPAAEGDGYGQAEAEAGSDEYAGDIYAEAAPDESSPEGDHGAAQAAPAPAEKHDRAVKAEQAADTRRATIRGVALGLLALGGAAVGWYYWSNQGYEETDDAQVEADVVAVPARTGGVVTRLFIVDNQVLKAGDPIAEIDSAPQAARLAQAEAELASAEANAAAADAQVDIVSTSAKGQRSVAFASLKGSSLSVGTLGDDIAQAQAAVDAATANRRQAEIELGRAKQLFGENAIPRNRLDAAQSAYDAADATAQQARARLAGVKAGVAVAEARVTEAQARVSQTSAVEAQTRAAQAQARVAHARVETAKAARDLAALELGYTKIVAPRAGVASRRAINVGQLVSPGMAVVQIVPVDEAYIVGNFKETQLGRMSVGQKAEITVDAFPGLRLEGTIESLSGGTGSRFSLLPAENATGNFVKVVQRVPVRVKLSAVPEGKVLRPGMSADVRVTVAGAGK